MDQTEPHAPHVRRRSLLTAGAFLLTPGLALAALPANRRLAFAVFRNGARVGDHLMTFSGEPGAVTVSTDVVMKIKLGPVPVFNYRHQATEKWAGGRFASLTSTTNANGKPQKVSAQRTGKGVIIETAKGEITAGASTLPLTHWNPDAFAGPLFNPQEGKLVKVTARRSGPEAVKLANGGGVNASRWSLRGDAEIDDWYDPAGVWVALRGKLPDGSTMEYRRV